MLNLEKSKELLDSLSKEEIEEIEKNGEKRKDFFQKNKVNIDCLPQYFSKLEKLRSDPKITAKNRVSTIKIHHSSAPGEPSYDETMYVSKDPNYVLYETSGICLWQMGFDPQECIGIGGFGIVWKCKDEKGNPIVVKHIPTARKDSYGKIEEFKNIAELNKKIQMEMEKNPEKKAKAKKHLNMFEMENEETPVLKGSLAEGDLESVANKKLTKRNTSHRSSGKTIDSVLRKSLQALKDVIYLHKKGFSHNDIKPVNFLKTKSDLGKQTGKLDARNELRKKVEELKNIEQIKDIDKKYKSLEKFLDSNLAQLSEFKKKKNKIDDLRNSKEKDIQSKTDEILKIVNKIINKSKSMIQLTDLDTITKIKPYTEGSKNWEYGTIATPFFFPMATEGDFLYAGYAPEEAVRKRDVYALGITFLCLLTDIDSSRTLLDTFWDCLSSYNNERTLNSEQKTKLMLLGEQLQRNHYKGEKNPERICNFISLIIKMTEPKYSNRCTLAEAYQDLKKI